MLIILWPYVNLTGSFCCDFEFRSAPPQLKIAEWKWTHTINSGK